MKIKLLTMSTVPNKRDDYWQCVFIPTIAMFYSSYEDDANHMAVNFEWLFWSLTILISNNDQRAVYNQQDI